MAGMSAARRRPIGRSLATRFLFMLAFATPPPQPQDALCSHRGSLRIEANMTLHLIKLCVGCDSIEDLASWQTERLKQRRKAGERRPQLFHRTFQRPKRRDELLAGGSLYWVIKGLVQVRQPLLDITEGTKEDGTPCCLLTFNNQLVPVRPVPRRAFQGWRYLDPDEAPPDLEARTAASLGAMPTRLRRQLAELGLI
jgi:hypothetical protein